MSFGHTPGDGGPLPRRHSRVTYAPTPGYGRLCQLTLGSTAAEMKITAIDIPTASGWGTELNEEAARKHAWNGSS